MTHNNEQEHTQEVEKDFDLGGEFVDLEGDFRPDARTKVVEYIRKLLSQHNKDMVEKIKGMEKAEGHEELFSHRNGYCKCNYNQAINDIKDLLTPKE